jgi:hypothetical protein
MEPPLKPNVLFLIDTSGSMGNMTPTGRTRLDEMKGGVAAALTNNAGRARFGLVTFPARGGMCEAASTVQAGFDAAAVDDERAIAESASRVSTQVLVLNASGGTPTGASVEFATTRSGFAPSGRRNFMILVTDGVPNCNQNNPHNQCTAPNPRCQCTTLDCSMQPACVLGCTDQDATVGAIRAARSRGIQTIVVGLSEAWDMPTAALTLEEMARAGGFVRSCQNLGDCGGAACTMGQCQGPASFRADTGAQLAAVLQPILSKL